jgi:hypothetical protein
VTAPHTACLSASGVQELISVRAVALKPVPIIGLYGALDEPLAPLDAAAHVSKEALWVWLTHAVAALMKGGIVQT